MATLAEFFKLRVKDQGERPTCVAFAVSAFHEFWIHSRSSTVMTDLDLSEEFLFYMCKTKDGLPTARTGTTISAASNSLVNEGQCLEELHPYRKRVLLPLVPNAAALEDGKKRLLKTLARLEPGDLSAVQQSIAKNTPVVAAIELFRSAYRPGPSGLLEMPIPGEQPVGRHAILIVEVENSGSQQQFVFLNSWGPKWGANGFGRFSSAYFSAHCKQVWTIDR